MNDNISQPEDGALWTRVSHVPGEGIIVTQPVWDPVTQRFYLESEMVERDV